MSAFMSSLFKKTIFHCINQHSFMPSISRELTHYTFFKNYTNGKHFFVNLYTKALVVLGIQFQEIQKYLQVTLLNRRIPEISLFFDGDTDFIRLCLENNNRYFCSPRSACATNFTFVAISLLSLLDMQKTIVVQNEVPAILVEIFQSFLTLAVLEH